MTVRTRLTKVLATIAASVALAGTLTPAAATLEPPPSGDPQIVCGPTRMLPDRLAKFCGTTEQYGELGLTGEYLVQEDRYVWSDQRWQVIAPCHLHTHVMGSDQVEAEFLGYPRLALPDGTVFVPGTQYGTVGGKRVARAGWFYPSKEQFYADEPWRPDVERGDMYPGSGTDLPPACP